MIRYEIIKNEVYQIFNQYASKSEKQTGLEHLISVTAIIQYLAQKRQLDIELASIIAILHDIATYKYHSSFDHANRSSMIAHELLQASNQFERNEIILITTAIKNHSHKERIDDLYSELIKDADLLVQYLNEPDAILSNSKTNRINNILGR